MSSAKPLMIQGTASHVGKSVLVSALCRILRQDGHRVAPFKAQNMALNSFVTSEGGEIGRAQAVQAEAAGLEPSVLMNPILIKPTRDTEAQVIVNGKVFRNMGAFEYHTYKRRLEKEVLAAYRRLARQFEIIVIEGAGSPAEINLRRHDIVNMRMAELAQAPVIITGDIDKGGVFASLVGTLELLTPSERKRVKALHINKFRGDLNILQPALDFLRQRCRKPLLGVTPYIRDIGIQEEDSLPRERPAPRPRRPGLLRVQIPVPPHISNFTDFDPLRAEQGIQLNYLRPGEKFADPDLIILPGSKNTIEDLRYLQDSGCGGQIKAQAQKGVFILGICGGYQMLGREILDPWQTESATGRIEGLGLLQIVTRLEAAKITAQVRAEALELPFYQGTINAYEIHMGRSKALGGIRPLFSVQRNGKRHPDGAAAKDFKVMGTYLHGIFDNDDFRRAYLNFVRRGRGLSQQQSQSGSVLEQRQAAYDRLAQTVRASIDMQLLYDIIRGKI